MNKAIDRVMFMKQLFMISPKEYEEMKTYAADNPITNQDSDEEVVKYFKEKLSRDFFDKILSMAKIGT